MVDLLLSSNLVLPRFEDAFLILSGKFIIDDLYLCCKYFNNYEMTYKNDIMKKKRISDFLIYPNVRLGKNVIIENFCIIGKPPWGKKSGELPTIIGGNALIRSSSVIYARTRIGNNFKTGHGVLIREDNIISDNVSIGTNTVLEFGNRIGNNVRIHSNCFLEMVTLEDGVFIGPSTVFTDDPHPRCPRFKECRGGVIVGKRAKIGANVTILPGVTIGERCLVGAGAVVTKSIPKESVVFGNPAKRVKKIRALTCPKKFFTRPYAWESQRY